MAIKLQFRAGLTGFKTEHAPLKPVDDAADEAA
mgnify:CR=1 FL=1